MKAVLGLQGGGKTAYSVDFALKNRINYDKILVNIEGFTSLDNIFRYDYRPFFDELLPVLYDMQVNQKLSDAKVIDYYCDFLGLPPKSKVLFIIDEAHSYGFGKKNDIILWLVTYHRHLFCEIMLITQHYKLIHSDYHIINDVVEIYSPKKQFFKNKIRYAKFTSFPPKESSFLENSTIKKSQSLFELYNSGGSVDSPKFFGKYIFYLISLLVLFYFLFSHFFSSPVPQGVASAPVPQGVASAPVPQGVASAPKVLDYANKIYSVVHITSDYFTIENTPIFDYSIEQLPFIYKALNADILGSTARTLNGLYLKTEFILLDSERLKMLFPVVESDDKDDEVNSVALDATPLKS